MKTELVIDLDLKKQIILELIRLKQEQLHGLMLEQQPISQPLLNQEIPCDDAHRYQKHLNPPHQQKLFAQVIV